MRALYRRLLHTTCVSLLGLVIAGHAHAAVLSFTGTSTIRYAGGSASGGGDFSTLPALSAPGAGTATISGLNLTTMSLPAGAFSAPFISIPVTDPAVAPIVGVEAKNIKNGAGSFNLGGKMAIQGFGIICLVGSFHCPRALINLTVPFTSGGVNGVGLGGAPVFFFNSAANIGVTVNGNPWVATTAKVGTVTVMGFVHGPASGGAATAGQASGVVQLVTPVMISTTIGAFAAFGAFDTLNLHFVPEPSTLLLLTSGVIALGMVGRRRMGK